MEIKNTTLIVYVGRIFKYVLNSKLFSQPDFNLLNGFLRYESSSLRSIDFYAAAILGSLFFS